MITGTLGKTLTVADGQEAAKHCALNIIATLKDELGDLDRVDQIVKLLGVVQSDDSFKEQHLVINGCSDFFLDVFGAPTGVHSRSAIGTNTLPLDIAVEIEAIVRIKK